MYVVVQKNYVGYETGYSIDEIYGPFLTYVEAHKLAESATNKDLYGIRFDVEELEADLPEYIKNWGVKS